MPSHLLARLFPCLLLAWLASGLDSVADIKLPTGSSVRVFPVDIEVEPGGSVEIPLTGSVSGNLPISFVTRDSPQAGKLGRIRQVSRNRAVITYTHSGRGQSDQFRYSGKVAGRPVSPSAPVRIRVKTPEEAFAELPKFLDFGTLFAGDVWLEDITLISNQRKRSVELRVDPPWRIDGPTNVTLQPGKSTVVKLIFEPPTQRDYLGYFQVIGTDLPMVRLHGSALDPFVVNQQRVSLDANPEQVDETLLIANLTGEDREIALDTSDNLEAPPLLGIPADGEHPIPFRYTGPAGQAGKGTLTIRHGVWSLPIEIDLQPGPPRWKWLGEGTLQLDPIKADSDKIEITLKLLNAGGTAGSPGLSSDHPALLVPPERRRIEPGESGEWTVSLNPAGLPPGRFEIPINLNLSGEANQELSPLLITGIIEPPDTANETKSLATPTPGFVAGKPALPMAPGLAPKSSQDGETSKTGLPEGLVRHEPIKNIDARLPRVSEIVQREFLRDNRDFRLVWNEPEGGPFEYAVDVEYMRNLRKGKTLLTWWPIQDLEFQRKSGTIETTLRELQPGKLYRIRIRVEAGNTSGPPSGILHVQAPYTPPPNLRWLWISLGGAVVIGLLIWRKRQQG